MNDLRSDPPVISSPDKIEPKRLLPILLVGLLIAAAALGGYYYYQTVMSSNTTSVPTLNSPGKIDQTNLGQLDFDKCIVERGENLLIAGVEKSGDFTSGTVRGTLTQVVTLSGVTTITVTSIGKVQTHKFILPNTPGLIFKGESTLAPSDLNKGDSVLLSFSCNNKHQSNFEITRVVVVSQE